jgi:hypothetical protein
MSAQPPRKSRKLDWVWQLRIELLDTQPLVWRRVLVPADITLPKLDRVIQTALGWTNSHLHEFVINGTHYAVLDPDWVDDLPHVDERRVVLHEALGMDTRCFDYVYDFGDDWHHLVLVENRYPERPKSALPLQCIGGENACPPEDVGGISGYVDFLAAIADPRHEEHQTHLEWVGGSFDPTRFDRAAVNRALAKIKL